MAIASGSLALDMLGLIPDVNWRVVALVFQLMFAVLVWWHLVSLNDALTAKIPSVRLVGVFVTDSATYSEMPLIIAPIGEERTLKKPTQFAHAQIANRPRQGTEQNHANNVVALLTYYDVTGRLLLGPIEGRWSGSDAPSTPGDIQKLIRRQIRSDGLIENLDIASKAVGSKRWYAFNNQCYFFSGMVHDGYELLSDVVDVHIELRGERVRRDSWVRMYNYGKDGGIRIEQRRSWLMKIVNRRTT